MNSDQQWIVRSFLKSLGDIETREPEPPHRIDLRLQLADMVLTELPGNDPDEVAVRAFVCALRDVYLTTGPQRHERCDMALRGCIDVLKSLGTQ
jgi:hypothetical protein